jgi:hypothetical protein
MQHSGAWKSQTSLCNRISKHEDMMSKCRTVPSIFRSSPPFLEIDHPNRVDLFSRYTVIKVSVCDLVVAAATDNHKIKKKMTRYSKNGPRTSCIRAGKYV